MLIAVHPVLEGPNQLRVAAGHCKSGSGPSRRASDGTMLMARAGDIVAERSLEFYAAVARQLAQGGLRARQEPQDRPGRQTPGFR